MDLLKAEIERKRRAVAEATKSAPSSSSSRDPSKKKRYLKASELRALENQQEEEELRARAQQRQKKRKRRRRGEDDDSDEGEEEDLQTLLTKKYVVGGKKSKGKDKDGKHGGDDNGGEGSVGRSESNQSNTTGGNSNNGQTIPETLKKMSFQEVTDSLRSFGLPIRLFGEVSDARLTRLFAAMQGREAAMLGESEKDEFALGSGHSTRNIFLERGDDEDEQDKLHKSSAKSRENQQQQQQQKLDNNSTENANITTNPTNAATTNEEDPNSTSLTNDPPKKIYRYFKSLLRQWEEDLSQRPDAIRRTAAGKNETKTLKQCKDYIRPLFSLCKSRQLEIDLQTHLFNIVTYCEQGEFVKAHDAYMDVAIGRAAWPIGVTMVGIHARSGRAKIESSNVAHVMNSEMHRKYLTSVKRLMSYAQKKRPDVDPSKKVMNL